MKNYDFTLKFSIPPELDVSVLENRLFEAGCDDALIGTGTIGRLALAFTRQASSASQAIMNALSDVRAAVPEARLIEVGPDLVGVTDMAEVFSFSRQNMRKLLQVHRSTFPLPLHEGKGSLWHLAEVLEWFEHYHHQQVDKTLCEVAEASMRTNLARELQRFPRGELEQIGVL